jgi:DNA-binding transcriptional regulator YiaG
MSAAEIKRCRKALGLKQTELAERLGVHVITVSRWERGTTPISHATGELLKLWVKQMRQQRERKA